MSTIITLGAGLVGKAIAIDLAADHEVTVVDMNPSALQTLEKKGLSVQQADLSDADTIKKLIPPFDLVVSALPGFMGYTTLKTIIETGKDVVDISFFEENPFQLERLAKENGVRAVIDAGVAPGLNNMILGYHDQNMDVQSFSTYVGGLPFKREWPFEYKAPFSPLDVMEEYLRPARLVENGQVVTKPPLSESELIDFEEVGTLEAFNTDGLRTLIHTMAVPNMKEKTLRYPGHIRLIEALKKSGFFDQEAVEVQGKKIIPRHLTAQLLKKQWQLQEKEEEFTLMTIQVIGTQKGQQKTHQYRLFDRYDPNTATTSMARTTGYTCTAVAQLLLHNKVHQKGLLPPEHIGADKANFEFILRHLKERGIQIA